MSLNDSVSTLRSGSPPPPSTRCPTCRTISYSTTSGRFRPTRSRTAAAAYGGQAFRQIKILRQVRALLAQPADDGIDDVAAAVIVVAPDVTEQFAARHGLAGLPDGGEEGQ